MTLHFHPERGTILTCDFHGLIVPEIVKVRPVVIVSPRPRKKSGLCTLVPLSTTPPKDILPCHYKIILSQPLSPKWEELELWAKCDLLYTMSFERLDRFYSKINGQRKYYDRKISEEHTANIMNSIRSYLGL